MTEKSIYGKISEKIDDAIETNQGLTLDWKEAVELRGYIRSLEEMYAIESKESNQEIARKDAIIVLLKEDAERLASTIVIEAFPHEWVCRGGCHHWGRFGEQIEHAPDCPIALHRALMKELE